MPSLGSDLKKIRIHLGYTIEDLRNATKLPLDTIHSIEDGSIFSDSKEINTYIRSFVRTYGRALKLDNDLMSKALDQEELGNYTGLLLRQFPELSDELPERPAEDPDLTGETDPEETDESPLRKKKSKGSPTFHFAGDEADEETSASRREYDSSGSSTPPDVRSIDWAGLGKGFKKKRSQPPVWIISGGLIILLIIAAAVLISQFGLFSSEEVPETQTDATEMQEPSSDSDLTLDLTEQVPDVTEPAPALNDTLYLTIYAAYNQLDPVRVWSDLKPRIDPYWIDQGTAFNFEFSDSIRVRGSYSSMLLFLNGNRIEDFRSQYFNEERNSVELTRDIFDSDPRWATPVPLELPGDVSEPDTLVNRPSF